MTATEESPETVANLLRDYFPSGYGDDILSSIPSELEPRPEVNTGERAQELIEKAGVAAQELANIILAPFLRAMLVYGLSPSLLGGILGMIVPPKRGMQVVYVGWTIGVPVFLLTMSSSATWRVAMFGVALTNTYVLTAITRMTWSSSNKTDM